MSESNTKASPDQLRGRDALLHVERLLREPGLDAATLDEARRLLARVIDQRPTPAGVLRAWDRLTPDDRGELLAELMRLHGITRVLRGGRR